MVNVSVALLLCVSMPQSPKDKKNSSIIKFKKNSDSKVYAALSPQGLNQHVGRDSFKSKALCESGAEVSKGKEGKKNGTSLLHFVWCFLPISSSNLLSNCEMYPVATFPVYSPICKIWCAQMQESHYDKTSQIFPG